VPALGRCRENVLVEISVALCTFMKVDRRAHPICRKWPLLYSDWHREMKHEAKEKDAAGLLSWCSDGQECGIVGR